MVYPNGRTIDYNYSGTNANSALDNAIGRLDAIIDDATEIVLEQYSYLGLSTIVARNHPQTGINLTYSSSGSIGAGGDQYVGLDQFGRVVNQNWINSATGASADNFTYTYDANSNVTAKNNLLDSAYSQTFTYDPLNRLQSSTLGGVANQSWTLDSQGNWSSFTSNGTTQTRTANAQNQITSVSGLLTPIYDANGNMTTDQAGSTYIYDAWNRLVEVKNSSGTVIAQYTYNAMGYRVTESYPQGGPGVPADTVKNLYYDSRWQVIEERWNGTVSADTQYQYVWSAAYVDAMVLRDIYRAGAIQSGLRIYVTQDANWNVTSLVVNWWGTWSSHERFVYDPYGNVTVLSLWWGGQVDLFNWQYMHQGGRIDPTTGLYLFRNRNYSPSLGTWTSQDPAGYINGANTYQFVMSNPVGSVDPSGECLSCWLMSVEFGLIPAEAGFAVFDSRAILVSLAGGEEAEPVEIVGFFTDVATLAGTVHSFYQNAEACEKCDPCHSNIAKVEADKKKVAENVDKVEEDAKKVVEAIKKIGEIIKW